MEAMEAVLTRRSIRKYTTKTVPADLEESLLRAAMSAPSAGNEQPWVFVVIRDKPVLARVPDVHPHAPMVPSAPLAVLVCGDLARERHAGFWVQDCSAATQNLLVAACALGLGAVWLGVYPRDERVEGLRKLLGIPERVVPFSLVPVGYPGEVKSPSARYDPERVHRDRW